MWLWIPQPTSVSSPVSEDSILPSDSLFQRLAVSAMWRSKHLRSASWRRVWKTAPWIRRLFGVTLEPSHQDSIVAAWLEQFSVSPVRISLSQESRKDLSRVTDQDYSTPPCGSFARLDASGCFLKTSPQFSLFPQDVPYSENLPKAGSMQNGFLFERPTWERPTEESGCSSWPTARAEDSECCGNHPGAQDSVGGATRNWHTPSTEDGKTDGPNALGRYGTEAMLTSDQRLRNQAATWKTPHGMGNLGASGKHGGSGGGEFAKQATKWPTPDACAMNDGESAESWRERQGRLKVTANNGNGAGVPLAIAAQELWTTPQAHDSAGGNPDRVRRKGTEHGCANLADDVTKWTHE